MKIGLLVHFPKSPAGENETLCRFEESIQLLGLESIRIPIDRNALTISEIWEIETSVDLILDIHFTYPRFFRTPTIGCLWTPLTYMEGWGLAGVLPNLLSSSYLLSTGNNQLKELALDWRPELTGLDISDSPLNHSLPSSWMVPPNAGIDWKSASLFYTGINWDKLSNSRGRHHDLLQILDQRGILNVYGPEKLFHVNPWEGYQGYKGEIPFDGRSILNVASQCGVYLVWSSEGHINENIMSNRLFEAMASNCVIIADNHPFIQKALGPLAFYVDTSKDPKQVADDVETILKHIKENPEDMDDRVRRQRMIFSENYALEMQLSRVLDAYEQEKRFDCSSIQIAVFGSKTKFLNHNNWLAEKVLISEISSPNHEFTPGELFDLCNSTQKKSWTLFVSEESELTFDAITNINRLITKFPDKQVLSLSGVVISENDNFFNPFIVTFDEKNVIPLQGLLVSSSFADLKKEMALPTLRKSDYLASNVVVWRLIKVESVFPIKIFSTTDSLYGKVSKLHITQIENPIRDAKSELVQMLRLPGSQNLVDQFMQLGHSQKRRIAFLVMSSLPGFNIARPFLRVIYRALNGILNGKH